MPSDRTGGAERGRPPPAKPGALAADEGREARERPRVRGSDGGGEDERGSNEKAVQARATAGPTSTAKDRQGRDVAGGPMLRKRTRAEPKAKGGML